MTKKIIELRDLIKKTNLLRKKKKIVLCHGTFDLIHIGHIKHFSEAKKFGDILIVSVTTDRYVQKGPNRPVFNLNLRMQALSALEDIDYIVASDSLKCSQCFKRYKTKYIL